MFFSQSKSSIILKYCRLLMIKQNALLGNYLPIRFSTLQEYLCLNPPTMHIIPAMVSAIIFRLDPLKAYRLS